MKKDLIDSRKKTIIELDKKYFRPLDVNTLLMETLQKQEKN